MKKELDRKNIKIVSVGHQSKIFGGTEGETGGCACCMCTPGTSAAGDITAEKH